MKTSVGKRIKDNELMIWMDDSVEQLRKEIWKTIFKHKGKLSDCDVSMALGIVQYELIHHTDEP